MTADAPDAEYTVLYEGPALAGRTTTAEDCWPVRSGEARGAWIARLGRGVPFRAGERSIQMRLVMPHFGSLWFRSLEEAVTSEVDWVAKVAKVAADMLPEVQGIVMLFDSRSLRLEASRERLERVLACIASVGLDAGSIPFVFQLNHRESPSALSIDEVQAALASVMPKRVAFVESIAPLRYGTHETFETIVAMIDGRAPSALSGSRRAALKSRTALFGPFEAALTLDGQVRERLKTRMFVNVIRFKGDISVARGWPNEDGGVLAVADARYAVEVVERHVERRSGGAWSPGFSRPSVIAARMRCADSSKTIRFEPFLTVGQSSKMFVLVGPRRRVEAARQLSFAPRTYNDADKFGFAVEDNLVLFNVGTFNETHVWVGYDARGRALDITLYGDDAAALLGRGPGAPETLI